MTYERFRIHFAIKLNHFVKALHMPRKIDDLPKPRHVAAMRAPHPQLTTSRLILRPLKITDVDRLARITNDPLVTRNLMKTACPFAAHNARKIILNAHRKRLPVWGVDDGTLVGLIGLSGEFGLWLERRVWGRGYGAEAGSAVIDYAFKTLQDSMLQANPIADNLASRHLLQKLGFRETARGCSWCKQREKIVPTIRMTLAQNNLAP